MTVARQAEPAGTNSRGLPRQVPIVRVPNFSTDLHQLGALMRMHPYLFGKGG